MSQAVARRSGNRGCCAQPCRSSYTLLDADKKALTGNSHLLSLMDLNLSGFIPELLEAGITSFKIEGRLKDLNYLKNITAFYRRKIDAALEKDHRRYKSSSGAVEHFFEPNPYRTFNRGYTTYFIGGRKEKVAFPQTQKSVGEFIGTVKQVHPQWFIVDTGTTVCNGDGLCYLHPAKGLEGALVNKTEGNKIYPAKFLQIKPGTKIYRNNDFLFEKMLSGNSADRRIGVSFELRECESGYLLKTVDEDKNRTEQIFEWDKIQAKDPEKSRMQIREQLAKLGNTAFICRQIDIPPDFDRFIPTAMLNKMRRDQIGMLENYRIEKYRAKAVKRKSSDAVFPSGKLNYSGNVANKAAGAFYRKHGVEVIEDAFELQNEHKGKILMTCKHCIKYQFDKCPVYQYPQEKWKEPLYIRDRHSCYRLYFDCKNCVMNVIIDD
jgi:putative protease